ncbi:MAG: DUF4139 domain-containing protein [Phycisphaerales bacterium]|nr:DUF4139 domain-containing protein [Phycisphaerales bacterium]
MKHKFQLRLKSILPALALAMLAGTALADETALTIYSSAQPGAISPDLYRPVPGSTQGYSVFRSIPGYAIIKQQRDLAIEQGISNISFTGVAALLDPTTVMFESLTDPEGTTVLEQDYRFDLLSMDKMLERYIDKEIIWGGQRVKLLSVSAGGMLLERPNGEIEFQKGYHGVRFPSMAEGLILKPTLNWMVQSQAGGQQETRISYETTGITWWADYNIVYKDGKDANNGFLDLSAWVSILNQSGGTYEDATLKLVAGDVNRAAGSGRSPFRGEREDISYGMAKSAPGFEQKSFFEYHLYTLGRKTTIPDRSTKQIELFDAAKNVPVEKKLLYDGSKMYMNYGGIQNGKTFGVTSNAKVEVFLAFENREEDGLGIPLPSGRIRVSKLDEADGSFEFIGEDTIDHTPKDEEIMIKLGNAFDVVGERRQTAFTRGKNWIVESFEIKVRNHKEQAVEVQIQEHLYRWTNAKITNISHNHEMLDARTAHIPVTIEADGEAVVTYTVRYDWE